MLHEWWTSFRASCLGFGPDMGSVWNRLPRGAISQEGSLHFMALVARNVEWVQS